jgi:hypothetical protein
MTYIHFVSKSFRLYVNVDKGDDEKVVLLGDISLERHESVKVMTGEDFNQLDGVLRLIEDSAEER